MTSGLPMNWPPQPSYGFDVLLREPTAQGYFQRALGELGNRVTWRSETDAMKYGVGAVFWHVETGPRDALTVQTLIKECDDIAERAESDGVEAMRFL